MSSLLTRSFPQEKQIKKEVRRVSRLDLFFDLIYVLLIRDLFHLLVYDIDVTVFRKVTLIFTPVWLIWQGYTFYVQRFEESTIRHRILTFALMACVGVYSYSIHQHGLFVTSELLWGAIAGHGILAYMFVSAIVAKHARKEGAVPLRIALHHVFFVVLWLSGFRLSSEFFLRIIVPFSLVISIISLLSLPLFSSRRPVIHSGHLAERYGLFILIVLAELIYGLIVGLSDTLYPTGSTIGLVVVGFLSAIAIWWSYFDIIGHNPLRKKALRFVSHWTLLHLPLSLTIIFLGGLFLHLIFQTSSSMFNVNLIYGTGGLFAMLLLIIGCLSFFHLFEYTNPKYKLKRAEHLPGIIMISEAIVFLLILLVVPFSDPLILIGGILIGYVMNMVLFHLYFDPLDNDEDYH